MLAKMAARKATETKEKEPSLRHSSASTVISPQSPHSLTAAHEQATCAQEGAKVWVKNSGASCKRWMDGQLEVIGSYAYSHVRTAERRTTTRAVR